MKMDLKTTTRDMKLGNVETKVLNQNRVNELMFSMIVLLIQN